jgi:hypothetical protein
MDETLAESTPKKKLPLHFLNPLLTIRSLFESKDDDASGIAWAAQASSLDAVRLLGKFLCFSRGKAGVS